MNMMVIFEIMVYHLPSVAQYIFSHHWLLYMWYDDEFQQMANLNTENSQMKSKVRRLEEDNLKKVWWYD